MAFPLAGNSRVTIEKCGYQISFVTVGFAERLFLRVK